MKMNDKHSNCFWLASGALFIVFFFMYYNMLIQTIGSDMGHHYVGFVANPKASSYTFNKVLIILLNYIGGKIFVAFFFAVITSLMPFVLYELLVEFDSAYGLTLGNEYKELLAYTLCIISGIFIPNFFEKFQVRAMGVNPWHSDTSLTMSFFGIISFVYYLRIYRRCIVNDLHITKDYYIFSLFLFLSTWCKPSFLFGFLPMIGVSIIVDIFRNKFLKTVFFRTLTLGLMVFPACFVLIWQYFFNFGSTEGVKGAERAGSTLIIGLSNTFFDGTVNSILKIVPGLVMPVLVCLIAKNYILNDVTLHIWAFFVSQFLIAAFTDEINAKGGSALNMIWGLYVGNKLLIALSMYLYLYVLSTIKAVDFGKPKINTFVLTLPYVIYLYQIVTGIIYIASIFVFKHYLF